MLLVNIWSFLIYFTFFRKIYVEDKTEYVFGVTSIVSFIGRLFLCAFSIAKFQKE